MKHKTISMALILILAGCSDPEKESKEPAVAKFSVILYSGSSLRSHTSRGTPDVSTNGSVHFLDDETGKEVWVYNMAISITQIK